MPTFQMPDGCFVTANDHNAARIAHAAAHQGVGHVPAPLLVTVTPVLTPVDNFANRSPTRFGVGEEIRLSFTTNPAGRAAASFGGLRWFVSSGPGNIVNDPGNIGTGILTCGAVEGMLNLELRTVTPPVLVKCSKRLQVIAPTDAVMQRVPGTGTFHRQGSASAGFRGHIYLRPMDVSFVRLQFREGAAPYEGTGIFQRREFNIADFSVNGGGVRHPVLGAWIPVLGGNVATGSRVNGEDNVRSICQPPFPPGGVFTWNIPWFYRLGGGGQEYNFTSAPHCASVDPTGRMTITKKGVTVTHAVTDPNSDP